MGEATLFRSRLNTRINGGARFSKSHLCSNTTVERARTREKSEEGSEVRERGGRGTKISEKHRPSNAMKFQWSNKVLIKENASFANLDYIARKTN